jgi:acyl-CoA reductase-like NAD-dependent aldehyde dehydrogenase
MKMYINGGWTDAPQMTPIIQPYTGETVDTVPAATPEQVEQTLAAASQAAREMGSMPAHERASILNRAADLIDEHVAELARLVSLEAGKPISEARGEAGRIGEMLRLSVFEGTQLRGETLPIDAHSGAGKDKLGLTMRVPCGVVVAISPFNYPLLLVMHKIGPALSAGNAVILKPANQTPLSALKLTELLYEAGLPENGLQTITGSGSKIGPLLCADSRVRKISFTGSTVVGEQITKVAGIKKLSLELGSSCPMIVLPDADLAQVAEATATGGFVNAGQVCISLQRAIVHQDIYADYLEAVKGPVEAIKVGEPLANDTKLSAMVSVQEAERVESWIDEAVRGGARVITGGERNGAVFAPTVVADVKPEMRISCDELFGPVVSVTPVADIDEAIALANGVDYGLGAGIFTRDINAALRFARDAESGNIMINWSPLWRADLMPYGGFKGSGIGKEGPRYAVEEMTEIKTVVFHGF